MQLFVCCAAAVALADGMNETHAETPACETRGIRVEGNSMSPRIHDGNEIKVRLNAPVCAEPMRRGMVLLLSTNSHRLPLIKALRGLPSDTFAVKNGQIVINGHVAKNSEGVAYQLSGPRAAMIDLYVQEFHGRIPPDMYLVMGEDPHGTIDSSRFGLIERAQILGKVVER